MDSVGSHGLKRALHWIPAALAVLMIAAESTATMSASNTSRWLLPLWVHLFGPVSRARWGVIHHLIRKTGHFTGYGVVSLCFFHGWRHSLSLAGRTLNDLRVHAAALSVGCTLLIASADEFHQSFLPSRTASPYDVGIDVCGALVMQAILLGALHLRSRGQELKPVSV